MGSKHVSRSKQCLCVCRHRKKGERGEGNHCKALVADETEELAVVLALNWIGIESELDPVLFVLVVYCLKMPITAPRSRNCSFCTLATVLPQTPSSPLSHQLPRAMRSPFPAPLTCRLTYTRPLAV